MARPRSFDQQHVIEAVRDQFWSTGYAGTSLDDLMRVSRLGKGSLYGAFGDKRQLFLEALRSYADETHRALREAIAGAPRALDALRAIVTSPVADPTGEAARRGCLMANSTCELASGDADVRAQAQYTFDTMIALIADGVARAQRQGDVPGRRRPDRAGVGSAGRPGRRDVPGPNRHGHRHPRRHRPIPRRSPPAGPRR